MLGYGEGWDDIGMKDDTKEERCESMNVTGNLIIRTSEFIRQIEDFMCILFM